MNLSSSKHSNSGAGESGWTMYLEQSFISNSSYNQYPITNGNHQDQWIYDTTQEDQLDLSMVSDASSGPNNPQEDNHDQQDCCRFYPNGKSVRKPKKEIKRMKDKGFYQSLDDTASSNPTHNLKEEVIIYNTSKVSAENSMESNGRQFKGKSTSVKKSYSRSSVK